MCLSPPPSGTLIQRQELSPYCAAEFLESPRQPTPPCYQRFSDIGDDKVKALVWEHLFPMKSRPDLKYIGLWGFVLEELQDSKLKIRVTNMFHTKTTPRPNVPKIEPSPSFPGEWLRNTFSG